MVLDGPQSQAADSTLCGSRLPRLLGANLLYLLTMVLVLTVGAWMQARSFAWGLLGTEFFLILLPTLLWIRRSELPLDATLRLRWPGC